MRRTSAGHKRSVRRAWLVVTAMLTFMPRGAQAQDAGEAHPVDSVLKMLNLKADAGRAPDFVEASRPSQPRDFMPVGTQHQQRTVRVKSPADLLAAEAALDAARIHQDAISGRKQPTATAPAKAKPPGTKPAPRAAATQN